MGNSSNSNSKGPTEDNSDKEKINGFVNVKK